ncbi:cysteine desulfurase family protein [Jeotgalibacillus proteolyticus]|uniref:cysteine desulfurase n=1 Tax=Jeotgalibacillus proteolyticus TaxID=2082395 RepID=A0A2S5GET0_9BACL|nr:cysteine desulfurase family protein [Jeotgalibacillus proteolyticus]PPA71506.1 cysteine desulfurase NifS [Jeotgalibacillus proteolyticus]
MNRIYADHAATTPVHPEVINVMTEMLTNNYGNASSIHGIGRRSRQALDEARSYVASSIGAEFNEIIFTSGGTESNNLAIMGAADAMKEKGNHIITTKIEHHAVFHPCEALLRKGYEVTFLNVDEQGRISVEELEKALTDKTILVTVMYGNNEIGTIQPIREIGNRLKSHQALFHTDAVQAYGIENIDVRELGCDLLSVSAHKINGPKGAGFLYVKNGTLLSPGLLGGEQERKRRAGTENIASISALAKAAEIAKDDREGKREQLNNIKKTLIERLNELNVDYRVNGSLEDTLPHVLNLSILGTDVEAMLVNLDMEGIAASSGSACTAGSIEPSHVLVAMFGKEDERLRNSIRFSFGLGNTVDDAIRIAETIASITKRLQPVR